MRFKILYVLLPILGCADGMGPIGDVNGQWAQSPTFPGSSLVFTLNQTGVSLSGSGTYSIEAGSAGTLQVQGIHQGSGVQLTLTYDIGFRRYFSGVVQYGRMVGTLTDSAGDSFTPTFVRR